MDREKLKDKLLSVTLENTELMKELAALKALQMTLGVKFNDSNISDDENSKSKHVQAGCSLQETKLIEQSNRQEEEIMKLKQEIQSLNAKCGNSDNPFSIRQDKR